MINFYTLVFNKDIIPKLKKTKEIDCNNKDMSIEEIVCILNEYEDFENLCNEHAYIVGLNNNMDITGIYIVSIGDSSSCNFYKKNILTFLLLSGSDKVILFHNHPSDILSPSENDLMAMNTLEVLTSMLNIDLIESVIVCKSGWYCIKCLEEVNYEI